MHVGKALATSADADDRMLAGAIAAFIKEMSFRTGLGPNRRRSVGRSTLAPNGEVYFGHWRCEASPRLRAQPSFSLASARTTFSLDCRLGPMDRASKELS